MLIDRPVVTDEGDTVGESDFKSRISWEVSPGGHSPSVDVKSTFQIGPKTYRRKTKKRCEQMNLVQDESRESSSPSALAETSTYSKYLPCTVHR